MDYRSNNPSLDENSDLYQTFLALPKIELHRHLEGSLRLNTMAEIAREFQLELPGYQVEDFRHMVQMMPQDEASADVFIAKFGVLRQMYRSPYFIDRIAYEVVADAASENIPYMELRFTPIALARIMDFRLEDVTGWVLSAVERACKDFGIDVRLIFSMNRHESVEIGAAIAQLAVDHMSRGVVGLDLAGAENVFPGAPFAPVFREARESGLQATIHAGEWSGAESVREAVEVLGAVRLGHGVRVIENSDVVMMVRERGIALETCPSSNVQSGVYPSYQHHPLRDLHEMGVPVTLNTDDPSIIGMNLTDEFAIAHQEMGFSMDELKQSIINSARASFLPAQERNTLVEKLEAGLSLS